MTDFDRWFKELLAIAEDKNCDWLISPENQESYREMWQENETPKDVFFEELSNCH